MNTSFTLSKRITSDGTAEVLVRFYSGRLCDLKAHTGIRVPASAWNATTQRLNLPRRAITEQATVLSERNRELDNLAAFLYDAFSRSCGVISSEWLRYTIRQFHGVKSREMQRTLADIITPYTEAHTLSPSRLTQYATLRTYLAAAPPLYISTATPSDIEALERFFRSRGLSTNTVATKLKAVRALFRYACTQGWCDRNPFDAYKPPAERYGSVTYLTPAERDTLAAADLPPALATQRDIFIFQCWTGCRVSDLYTLTRRNIINGVLEYLPRKTKGSHPVTVRVPLAPPALAILDRYRLYARAILPFISTQRYNDAIKRCIILSGIDRDVIVQDPRTRNPKTVRLSSVASSHLARRTFAEAAFLASGSERVVSSMTGHSANSTALRRYTEVTDSLKVAALQTSEKKPT